MHGANMKISMTYLVLEVNGLKISCPYFVKKGPTYKTSIFFTEEVRGRLCLTYDTFLRGKDITTHFDYC